MLGPLAVLDDGRTVDLGGIRRRTLLAVLLAHRDHVVSVDRLLDEVWQGSPPAHGRDTLQAHLAHLRRALAKSGADLTIDRQSPGYRIRAPQSAVDAGRFEHLAAEGRRSLAAGEHEAAVRALSDALDLWTGEVFDGVHETPSVSSERTRLAQLRRDATEDWAEAQLALAREAEVIAGLRALLSEDPWRERATGQLMIALYRTGRQADALAAYEHLRRSLADDLGLVPSPDLRALESDILRHQGSHTALTSAEMSTPPRKAPPLVGRDTEITSLLAALRRTAAGEKVVALVRGEAGVGKTRLVRELAVAGPAHGVKIMFGRCDETPASPYQPFVEAIARYVESAGAETIRGVSDLDLAELARVVPRLAERVTASDPVTDTAPGFERLRFFEAVTSLLRSLAPVMVVIDDMHWADQASVALLKHILRAPDDVPVCVMMTTRAADPATDPAIAAATSAQREGIDVVHLGLEGIDELAIASLVRNVLPEAPTAEVTPLAAALRRATNGNPFFVSELLRNLLDSGTEETATLSEQTAMPTTVRDAVAARLAHLSDNARELLRVATVIGEEFDLDVLAAATSQHEDAALSDIEQALQSGVVIETAEIDRFSFTHTLYRWVIGNELSSSRRARLHHLIGTTIERLRAEDLTDHLGALAFHFSEAAKVSDAELAVVYCRRAGERAVELLAYEEAAQHFRRALDGINWMSDGDDVQRCELLISAGDALNRSGNIAEGCARLSEAAELAIERGDAERLGRSALLYGGPPTGPVDVDDRRIALLERALRMLGDGRPQLRARLMSRLAEATEYAPDTSARELSKNAVALARTTDDAGALAAALYANVSLNVAGGRGEQRLQEVVELLELARKVGDVDLELLTEAWRIVRLLELGDSVAASDVLTNLDERTTRLRQPFYDWGVWGFRAMLTLLHGSFDKAEALASRAFAIGERVHPSQARQNHAIQLLTIRWCQGRLEEMAHLIEGVGTLPTMPSWGAIRVWFAFQTGDGQTARAQLRELSADGFHALATGPFWPPTIALVGEACAAVGEAPDAEVLYQRLLPLADEAIVVGRASVCLGAAARYLGLLAARLGLEAADEHFQRAVSINKRMGARPFTALTRYEYAGMLLARGAAGDESRAAALMDEASNDAEGLGMLWLKDRLDEMVATMSTASEKTSGNSDKSARMGQ